VGGTTLQQPTLKERQRAERETLILDEAERMLNEQGYHDLVMEQLAERVGIGKGTIYLHFPRKEDLIGAVIARGLDRLAGRIEVAIADGERGAGERLREIMATVMSGHFDWLSTLGGPDRYELMEALKKRADKSERFEKIMAMVGTLIDQGKANGEFDPAIATPVASVLLFSFVRALSSPQLRQHTDLDTAGIAEAGMRLYFHGLQARPEDKESR
jgi:TetR/AcrR family transcriptional regulator, fatty acid metabolism regulator protein